MAIALKYASSFDQNAKNVIVCILKKLLIIKNLVKNKSEVKINLADKKNIEDLISICVLSLSVVMAGSSRLFKLNDIK